MLDEDDDPRRRDERAGGRSAAITSARAARSTTRSSISTSGSRPTRTLYEAHRLSHVVKDRLMEAYPADRRRDHPHRAAAAAVTRRRNPKLQLPIPMDCQTGSIPEAAFNSVASIGSPSSSLERRIEASSAYRPRSPPPLLLDDLPLHLQRRRQLAALDRELARQERDALDALELRQLAVEGVDDLLVERDDVGRARPARRVGGCRRGDGVAEIAAAAARARRTPARSAPPHTCGGRRARTASAISGLCLRTSSIGCGAIFLPPEVTSRSFLRSVMRR